MDSRLQFVLAESHAPRVFLDSTAPAKPVPCARIASKSDTGYAMTISTPNIMTLNNNHADGQTQKLLQFIHENVIGSTAVGEIGCFGVRNFRTTGV